MSDLMSILSATSTPTTQTSGSSTTGSSSTGASSSSSLGLTSNDFLKLLVAQLQYQDPNNPTDSSQMMAQTAQLQMVDSLNSISSNMTSLLSAEQSSSATSMLGQTVHATDASGNAVSGTVTGVKLLSSGPLLTVNGADIPFSSVTEVDHP